MGEKKEESGVIPEGALYTLRVDDGQGGSKVAYLKRLPRPILEKALGLIANPHKAPELIRAGEVILHGCWVGGDDEIKTDEELLTAAALQATELVERRSASLKKN